MSLFLIQGTKPLPLEPQPPPLPDGRKLGLPVAVMASNRPVYLYRMLKSLLRVQGLELSQVTVYVDGFHHEVVSVAELFGFRVQQHKAVGKFPNSRIAQVSKL